MSSYQGGPREEICAGCYGTGKMDSMTDSGRFTCTWCGGTGQQNEHSQRFGHKTVTRCAHCHGKGYLDSMADAGKIPCPYCS